MAVVAGGGCEGELDKSQRCSSGQLRPSGVAVGGEERC
jgi:hypothetical protein